MLGENPGKKDNGKKDNGKKDKEIQTMVKKTMEKQTTVIKTMVKKTMVKKTIKNSWVGKKDKTMKNVRYNGIGMLQLPVIILSCCAHVVMGCDFDFLSI